MPEITLPAALRQDVRGRRCDLLPFGEVSVTGPAAPYPGSRCAGRSVGPLEAWAREKVGGRYAADLFLRLPARLVRFCRTSCKKLTRDR